MSSCLDWCAYQQDRQSTSWSGVVSCESPLRMGRVEAGFQQALQAGITLAPGYIFSATQQYRNFIRLNAASWSMEAERAVGKLGELVAAQKQPSC